MQSPLMRAWVEIDLDALRRNGAAMAARCAALLPMVKADAYGLGAVAVARALTSLAPWGFGVATVDEGRELRDAGLSERIMVFTPVLPAELAALRAARLTPVLSSADDMRAWRALGGGPWHLSIDTGMSRAGMRWSNVTSLAELIRTDMPEGAYTHFHSAELDDTSRAEQEARFDQAVAALPARPSVLHAENSSALARVTRSRYDIGRPGVFLYGVGSGRGALVAPEQVAHVRARVVAVRDVCPGDSVSYDATWRATSPRRIATLAIGYADGYRRSLGNRGTALLGGRRAPVAGVVTMDMTMIDVTDVPCRVGDVATLMGGDGADALTTEEVAVAAGVSPYELLTGLRGRLERVVRSGAAP
ncbi:MAG: alanine racemase [Gemmatimonadaceae bacterium]